jgi:hypothetical protein
VNCNRSAGSVDEVIYDLDMDVEAKVKQIMSMNPNEVAQQEKQLIGSYPNTYTYTKSMAERSLFKKMGNLKCVLFRPSIIAASLN